MRVAANTRAAWRHGSKAVVTLAIKTNEGVSETWPLKREGAARHADAAPAVLLAVGHERDIVDETPGRCAVVDALVITGEGWIGVIHRRAVVAEGRHRMHMNILGPDM